MAKKKQDDGTEIETDEFEAPKETVMAKVAHVFSSEPLVELVPMKKGRELIDVHPTTVKDHQEAGWEVA